MKLLKTLLISTLIVTAAQAQEVKNFVLSDSKASGITFKIKYSLGVHDGVTSGMKALVTLSNKNSILKGEFSVPIDQVSTGNLTRDCHMREALGIDYKDSKFPTDHVCDSDNKLPVSGPDSVAFPEIRFSFTNIKKATAELPAVLEVGRVYDVAIQGQWTLHGQTVDLAADTSADSIPVKIKLLDEATQEIQVTGNFQISLKAFNIQVKPFKIAIVKIGVDDIAKVILNTKFILKK